eukprot:TRINITY_DN14353_c0_g1_i1.p1 TRINITY_DN14353_c0_g1~~TRINITY_DN14353_c0_g1_i1.p1  ORF type:complete len:274 (-),score=75.79 TRINITY_DN14353_c0_g1_i1:164-985(-)
MAMSFMCQKSWHPNSKANQKKKWIAEQQARDNEKRETERKKELEEERNREFNRKLLGSTSNETDSALDFMYKPPPGMDKVPTSQEPKPEPPRKDVPNLEYLKNAPSMGRYTEGIEITHKPLGIEVRKVRCARCGEWGHTSGDRECKLKDINPNDEFRQRLEDPMGFSRPTELDGNLKLKENIRRELDPHANDADLLPASSSSDEELDPEQAFIDSLTRKDKKKLLKHLKKQQKKQKKRKSKKVVESGRKRKREEVEEPVEEKDRRKRKRERRR